MADDLDDLRRLAPDVDAPAAAAAFRRRRRRARSVRRGALATAAVAVLVAGTVGVLAAGDDDASVIAGPGGTGGPVTFEVLSVAEATEPMGTLLAATDEAALDDLWARSGSTEERSEADLDERAVVSITIPDDACPPELTQFDRAGDEITPVFVEPDGACEQPLIPKTYVVALDRAPLGVGVTLRLPANETYGYGEQRLRVDLGGGEGAADLPRVWAQAPSTSLEGMAAEIRGKVQHLPEQDCFRILLEGVSYPVVWPAGTVGTADGPGVVLPDGRIARTGDEVYGGGGYLDVADEYGIPPECLPETGEVAVFNPNGEVTVNAREGAPGPEPTCGEIEAFADRLLNVGIDYDYQPSASPEALFVEADLVLTGTLRGGFDAREVEAEDDRSPSSFVGYEVDVAAVYKSPPAARLADRLYIWLEHGLASAQAEAFEEALVPGLHVVVFAHESAPGFVAAIEGFATACPDGPPIGRVGSAGTWADLDTLDDLVARLEQAVADNP